MRYQLFFPLKQMMVEYWAHPDVLTAIKNVEYEKVYEGTVRTQVTDPEYWNGFLWQRHNVGDMCDGNRPLADTHRSMRVGDILVHLDTRMGYVADVVGFRELSEHELRDMKLLS